MNLRTVPWENQRSGRLTLNTSDFSGLSKRYFHLGQEELEIKMKRGSEEIEKYFRAGTPG